jgi:hypothetical protein
LLTSHTSDNSIVRYSMTDFSNTYLPLTPETDCNQTAMGLPPVMSAVFLRASEGTLSRWSRLHLQPLAPSPVSGMVDVRQAAGRKNNCRVYHMIKNKLYRRHLVG